VGAPLPIAYLNGAFVPVAEARISPLDRGFLFADGIYEVIPVYAGKLFRLEEHLDRLDYSLREIQLKSPLSRGEWRAMLEQLVQKNGSGNLSVYLQVTRGEAAVREHAFPPAGTQPTVFAMCSPISKPKTEDIVLDFNLCYNPYCSYSPFYSCPIPPEANTLPTYILAGEKIYKTH